MSITLAIIIIVLFVAFLVWAVNKDLNRVKKDWKTLDYFEDNYTKLKTREEIEVFYEEFKQKSSKINNQFINPRHDFNKARTNFLRFKEYLKRVGLKLEKIVI